MMNKLRDLWDFAKHENNRDFTLEVVKTFCNRTKILIQKSNIFDLSNKEQASGEDFIKKTLDSLL